MSRYIADQSWPEESSRLTALERALDPNTRRYLDALGLAAGQRCLEVGAGSGSIAAYMARRVGTSGLVVATDIDTTLLEPLAASYTQLQLRREDVAKGVALPSDEHRFDVVHARLVLGHVEDRLRALRHLVQVLRPGGWVLVEDVDFLWVELGGQPIHPAPAMVAYQRVWSAVVEDMNHRGYAVHWGRQLAHALCEIGLEQVGGEATMLIGSPALLEAMRMTIERFGPALIESQRITAADLAECMIAMSDPATVFTGSPMFSVWGRRPIEG